MSKGKILVVDDEPDIIRTISMRLKSVGYKVLSAMDGLQATTIALREEPDLIILDIGMPAGDGHVVAKRLKASAKTCTIPIIFLTARTADSDYEEAMAVGVSRYLIKPLDPQKLLICVEELLLMKGKKHRNWLKFGKSSIVSILKIAIIASLQKCFGSG